MDITDTLSPLGGAVPSIQDSLPLTVALFLSTVKTLINQTNFVTSSWPQEANVSDGDRFDVVIAGGGTAGCVLANRLSEVKDLRVLLIEAGDFPPIISTIPGLYSFFPHTPYDWDYQAKNTHNTSQTQNFHSPALTSGKMFGGTSSLCHLLWSRGKRTDFDSSKSDLWNWETALKYFKKLEGVKNKSIQESPYAEYDGTEGPIILTGHNNRTFFHSEDVMLKAIKEIGYDELIASTHPDEIGYSKMKYTVTEEGIRASTAYSYLAPASHRKNLSILRKTLVTKILIDSNNRAVGVEVKTKLVEKLKIYANKEVILSAGNYNSPQLLMLSGIGPKEELEKHNIQLIKELPVGKNWKDHILIPLALKGKTSPASSIQTPLSIAEFGGFPLPLIQGLFNLTDEINPAIQHLFLNFGASSPLLLITCSVVFNYNPELCAQMITQNPLNEVLFSLIVLLHPKSTGRIILKSSNPEDPPLFETGFFSDERDAKTLVKGLKKVLKIKEASYFRNIESDVIRLPIPDCDHLEYQSEEYWECYVVQTGTSHFHGTGTCKMGDDGVVDDRLRVHGINNLRVADASVMPFEVSGETLAATIMLAEREADLIKEDLCGK